HRGGAHHRRADDQVVGVQVIDVDQFDGAVAVDRLDRHQLADVGIAPASRPEDGGAQGDVFDLGRSDPARHAGHLPGVGQVPDGLDPDAGGIGRQVGQGNVLNVDDLHGV